MFKVHHLLACIKDLPQRADVVITLQETWLQSHDARQRLRYQALGEGWTACALDRSLPSEPKSGGLLTLVREGQRHATGRLHVQHEIDLRNAINTNCEELSQLLTQMRNIMGDQHTATYCKWVQSSDWCVQMLKEIWKS